MDTTSRRELRLQTFDWTGLVRGHFFESTLVGMLGAVIGILNNQTTNNYLTVLCLILAFMRVWRAIREEHEWSALWDEIVESDELGCAGEEQVRDSIMEAPFVLSMMFLPVASINVWTFTACLLLFYVTTTRPPSSGCSPAGKRSRAGGYGSIDEPIASSTASRRNSCCCGGQSIG